MASTTFLQPTAPRLRGGGIIRRNGLTLLKRVSIVNAHQDGSEVDENMIVLRMRIKKIKVLESGGGGGEGAAPPSSDWSEWEKKVFTHYHEGVFDYMEMLQGCLMNTRPSVALGMMTLIAMSLPLSSSVVMMNVLKLAKGLLAGCHVCIDIDF
ncbi:hypothetical protein ACS0TY_029120 [Phlomoides rotata]